MPKKPNFASIMNKQIDETKKKIEGKGINSLITSTLPKLNEGTPPAPSSAAQSPGPQEKNKPQYKTKDNEVRATFLVKEDFNEKIKSYAYFNRVLVKDIIDEALDNWIREIEAAGGPIRMLPKPKKRR